MLKRANLVYFDAITIVIKKMITELQLAQKFLVTGHLLKFFIEFNRIVFTSVKLLTIINIAILHSVT